MKTQHKNYLAALGILFLTLFASCNDDFIKGVFIASNNEYALHIQSGSLQDIPAEGGAVSTRIESSNAVNWEIQNLADWINALTLSGNGSQEVIFNMTPNESFTSSRTHIFNIVTTNSDWGVTIPVSATQNKKSISLSITPSDNASWTFDSEGGSKELKISSNVEWTVDCQDSFVTLSKKAGNGNASIIISLSPYKYLDVLSNRTSYIYFRDAKGEEVLQVLTITQVPLQSSIESETINVEFDQNKNSKNFLFGEVDGTYSVSSDAPWLSITKNNDSIIDVTISADANGNEEERTSQAYVYLDRSNSIKYIFTVKQRGELITLTPQSLSCGANGGSYTVKVETNSKWKTTNMSDWISIQEDSFSCIILISENNSLTPRVAEILFNRVNSYGEIEGKTVKLTVNQESRTINSDNETLQFGPEASSQNLHIESDAQWTLASTEDWISVSTSEGAGDKDVTVSVSSNTTSSNRVGKLNLTCLGKVIEINVIQESAYINTPSSAIVLDAIDGSAEVTVSTNLSWTAASSEPWLTLSPSSGVTDSNLKLTASDNQSPNPRNAVVTISTSLRETKMNVTQKAPSITTSKSIINFDYISGVSSPIIVNADGEYSVTTSSNWITFSQEKNTLKIKVDQNDGEARTGIIKLSLKNTSVSATITVQQSGSPYPYVDLGLPSGTKWCICNIGASTKIGYGSYLSWDDANNQIPYGYGFPSSNQADELIEKCKWTSTTINSINGYLIQGPNGNTIFLPSGGLYNDGYGDKPHAIGVYGCFWLSNSVGSNSHNYLDTSIHGYMVGNSLIQRPGGVSNTTNRSKLNIRLVKK